MSNRIWSATDIAALLDQRAMAARVFLSVQQSRLVTYLCRFTVAGLVVSAVVNLFTVRYDGDMRCGNALSGNSEGWCDFATGGAQAGSAALSVLRSYLLDMT